MRKSIFTAVVFFNLFVSPQVTAQEICESGGVDFGFFNGVQTQPEDAKAALFDHIYNLYGTTTPDGEPITYTLFYNDTDGLADFVETFEQRLQENGGVLAGRFELFFSTLKGGGSWWDRLQELLPAATDVLSGLVAELDALLVSSITASFGSPNTAEVSQRQLSMIDHAVAMNRGLLLMAHSQGNLFVNQAYHHALKSAGPESVRVVHIAPASPQASGPHTLANLDLVINGLRGTGSVLPNTDEIPAYAFRPAGRNGKRDLLGHGLLEIYLNSELSTFGRINTHVMLALAALKSPRRDATAPYPAFVNKPWLGGDKPQYEQYAVDTSSHRVEEIRETNSNGGSWFYTLNSNASNGHWRGAWAPNREITWSQIQQGIFENTENSFSSQVTGRGVNGSKTCLSSTVFTPSGKDRMIRKDQSNCTYNNYLVDKKIDFSNRGTPHQVASMGPVAVSTEVKLDTATWGPFSSVYSERFENGQQIREVQFLNGERRYQSTIVYLHTWLGIREESRSVEQNINTVEEIRVPYISASSLTDNQDAIDVWVSANRAWMTSELQRLEDWIKARDEYEKRQSICTPPPPPTFPEGCTLEDASPECMSARGERD